MQDHREPLEIKEFEGTIMCKNVFPDMDGAITSEDQAHWATLNAFALQQFPQRGAIVKVIATPAFLRFYF